MRFFFYFDETIDPCTLFESVTLLQYLSHKITCNQSICSDFFCYVLSFEKKGIGLAMGLHLKKCFKKKCGSKGSLGLKWAYMGSKGLPAKARHSSLGLIKNEPFEILRGSKELTGVHFSVSFFFC